MDHVHLPVKILGPDGKEITVEPPSCLLCFLNEKDKMANRIWKFYEAQVKAAKQLLKKKKK